MRVGRYKFNKKLSLATRIQGQAADTDIADPRTGEVLIRAGETISREKAREIQNAGVRSVDVRLEGGRVHRVVGNHFVDAAGYLPFDPRGSRRAGERASTPCFMEILGRLRGGR